MAQLSEYAPTATATAIRLMVTAIRPTVTVPVTATRLMALVMAPVTAIRLMALAMAPVIRVTGVTELPITRLPDTTSMPLLRVSIIIVIRTNAGRVRALESTGGRLNK